MSVVKRSGDRRSALVHQLTSVGFFFLDMKVWLWFSLVFNAFIVTVVGDAHLKFAEWSM